jgi:hypothetical protein
LKVLVLILSSLHLQALKESAISKQLTICPKIKIWYPNFKKILSIFQNKSYCQDQEKSYLENKLDFSSKQQRFIKQRKFTWQSPYMVFSFEHTSVKLNLNYQNKKSSISDFTFAKQTPKPIFWFKQKNSCNSIADQNLFLLRRQK